MNNIQINGQRRWGPPENWSGPPPVHGTEIFIKNLPKEVFELELYAIFSMVGSIYEVRLPVNWNGHNRGYAFLRFTSISAADKAINVFDNYEIRKNRKINVARSIDNTRLFLSAVPIEKNAEELKRDLSNYVENVRTVYVYPTLENRSVFRGYAFVEFETHRDAAIAKRILTPEVCHGIFEKKCVAAWANPLPFLDESVLKSLNVLFIRNIPKDISTFHLKQIVENLTKQEIQRIKKLNDFAFLTFKDHKSAKNALMQLKNAPLIILDHETQAEWAVPKEMVVPHPEKEFEESGNSCTSSESSGWNSLFQFNSSGHQDVFNIHNCFGLRNNPSILQERRNVDSSAISNYSSAKEETVFCINHLKDIKEHIARDMSDPYCNQQQNWKSDFNQLNVLLSPAVGENDHFNSSSPSFCQPGYMYLPKSSTELYSPPLLTGNNFGKSQGKTIGHMEFSRKITDKPIPPFPDVMKNLENMVYPLQRIHIYNSDSDSDENLVNLSQLGASPSSMSAMTNWSSGTASQNISSDEQDIHPQSPIREFSFIKRRT